MTGVQFTLQDIEDLDQKLSTLQPFLSDKERNLLVAIFAAAVDRIEVSTTDQGTLQGELPTPSLAQTLYARTDWQQTLADLQQQLLNAYIPEGDASPVDEGGMKAKITTPPPPPPPLPPPPPPPPAESAAPAPDESGPSAPPE
jgi:hypothetical protein